MTRRTGPDATWPPTGTACRRPVPRGRCEGPHMEHVDRRPEPGRAPGRRRAVTIRVARSAAALVLLLVLGACARGSGDDGGGGPAGSYPYAPDDLVLQISWTGGFVTPQMLTGRLPLVSVYGDGRVVTEGPVAAIYPGPALPNLQVQRIDAAAVQALVDRALDAGVGETGDLGTPPLADAPSTRFTVSTGLETRTSEAYALSEDTTGITGEQAAARAELLALLGELTDLSAGAAQAYVPAAVAALATEYPPAEDPGLVPPDAPWPGPALPGDPLEARPGPFCVVATGDQATAVLEAAGSANALTPWLGDAGARWSLLLRPLLPDETGCADLRQG